MYSRYLNIINLLRKGQSVLLIGPRGSGKSVLSKESLKLLDVYIEINLLQSDNYLKYLKAPEILRKEIITLRKNTAAGKTVTVFIDEIQKIPTLMDEIHWLIENQNNVNFILTGSSARKLKSKGVNLLAGRVILLNLFPFTHTELMDDFELSSALKYGTLPLVFQKPDNETKELTLHTYTETYLREEIKEEALVRKIDTFARFLDVAAQMNGEIINYCSLAKKIGASDQTIKDYYQILYDTLTAIPIPGWHRSVRKQITKSPKSYFFDCGVVNSLRRELKDEINLNSFRGGKLFETFVILEIYRLNHYTQKNFQLYHWRTNDNQEVDLVLQKNSFSQPIAIEIKSSDKIFPDDLKHIRKFKEEEPEAKLIILSNVSHPFEEDNVEIHPWSDGIKKIFELG